MDLENLDFGGNAYMSGPIPPEIGKLIKLQYLWLGDSNLSGTLPPEIGNLSRLRVLQIDGNPLFGPLPETPTNLNNQQFWFDRTSLCEPPDQTFQAWLDTMDDLQGTQVACKTQNDKNYQLEITMNKDIRSLLNFGCLREYKRRAGIFLVYPVTGDLFWGF